MSSKLRHDIIQAYFASFNKSARVNAGDSLKISKCGECRSDESVIINDKSSGDSICSQCGMVLNSREIVQSMYGVGITGSYSMAGIADATFSREDVLDLATGEKHFKHGRTRKWYKDKLKREANEEIDGLVNNESVAKRAKIMFHLYTDTLEAVHDKKGVLDACIWAASSPSVVNKPPSTLQFSCKVCCKVFSTKRDRRLHSCKGSSSNTRKRKAASSNDSKVLLDKKVFPVQNNNVTKLTTSANALKKKRRNVSKMNQQLRALRR